jgi:hypothetical protein
MQYQLDGADNQIGWRKLINSYAQINWIQPTRRPGRMWSVFVPTPFLDPQNDLMSITSNQTLFPLRMVAGFKK